MRPVYSRAPTLSRGRCHCVVAFCHPLYEPVPHSLRLRSLSLSKGTPHRQLSPSPTRLLPFTHNESVEKKYSHSLVISYEHWENNCMPTFEDTLSEVTAAIALLPSDAESFTALSDAELTGIPAALAAARHQLEAREARVAGEIARRSSYDLGYQGLAQKAGFRTPEKLVQHLTGSTGREASKLVRTGVIIHESESLATAERTGEVPSELTKPWLAPLGRPIAAGVLPLDAAEAIRIGLGVPTTDIGIEMLATAAAKLVILADLSGASPLNADQLLDRARTVRDELDEAGIADQEASRHRAQIGR